MAHGRLATGGASAVRWGPLVRRGWQLWDRESSVVGGRHVRSQFRLVRGGDRRPLRDAGRDRAWQPGHRLPCTRCGERLDGRCQSPPRRPRLRARCLTVPEADAERGARPSPGITPLVDVGDVAQRLFCVSPFLEGESLRARLTRERQLPLASAVAIVRQVAEALGYAHAEGLLHKDVKPENIFLSGSRALVTDLGLSRAITR